MTTGQIFLRHAVVGVPWMLTPILANLLFFPDSGFVGFAIAATIGVGGGGLVTGWLFPFNRADPKQGKG